MAIAPTGTGANTTAFATGSPLVLAQHALADNAPTIARWTAAGTTVDTDITDADFPVDRARDGYTHEKPTKPDTAATTSYLVFALSTPAVFDGIIIQGRNMGTTSVSVEIDTDGGFATDLTEVATWAPSGQAHQRLVNVDLGGARSQYTASYIRIKFVHASSDKPALNEFFFGTTRQLGYYNQYPYENHREQSSSSQFESEAGVVSNYIKHRGRALRNPSFDLPNATELTAMQNWWADTQQGTRAFYWVESPNASPLAYYMRFPPTNEFNPMLTGPVYREHTAEMRECAPFVSQD